MDQKGFVELTKETNTMHKEKVQVVERIHEFQLPQHFPSMVKELIPVSVPKLNIKHNPTSFISKPIVISNRLKISSNLVSSNVPCKKLRIVSLNGKDLGEFNLKVRNTNSPEGQIFTITKSNILKPVLKPVTLILNPVSMQKAKIFPRILRQQSTNKKNNRVVVNLASRMNHTIIKCNATIVSPVRSIMFNKNDQIIDTNEKVQITNGETSSEGIGNNECKMSIPKNGTDLQLFSNHTANRNSQKHQETKHELIMSPRNIGSTENNLDTLLKNSKVETSSTTPKDKVCSSIENVTYREIAESPFPIVSCKRLVLTPNNNDHVQISEVHDEKHVSTATTITENKKVNTSLGNVSNSTQILSRKVIYPDHENNIMSCRKELRSVGSKSNLFRTNSDAICITKNLQETRTQKDIMTIVPNHNSFSPDKNVNSTSENCTNYVKSSPDNDVNLISEFEDFAEILITNMQTKKQSKRLSQSKDCPKNDFETNLLEQLNVIKKAVTSVTDEELRSQALKALADCRIGVERRIPKHPPKELKSVHDTQVQTAVFGLLDPRYFMLLNDMEEVERLQQLTVHEFLHRPNLLSQNNLVPDSVEQPGVSQNPDVHEDHNFDIDNFVSQICEENLDALQVKETLSTTNVRYQKIIEQLQKDFELVKKYDEDGMLCIHKAVIKNNIYDVQRYLMVLKQCKESVDILTKDGVVSLMIFFSFVFNPGFSSR